MIQTSYFAKAGRDDGAVSIAIGTPRWFGSLPRYLALAPTREMLAWVKEDPLGGGDRYDVAFNRMLAALDPAKVSEQLHELTAPHDPIILCWEKPPSRCHRRLVAEWLEDKLGIEVPELGFARHRTPAYADMPRGKPKKEADRRARRPFRIDVASERGHQGIGSDAQGRGYESLGPRYHHPDDRGASWCY